MPRRITAEGVVHTFPDDATDAEISAALNAIPQPNAAAAPKARTWADTAVDALPAVAGAIGGVVGGIGGTVAGMGVGGVPGAIGGATLGGAAGESAKQLINRARGAQAPASPTQAATDIALQGGVQGAAETVGAGVGGLMAAAGPRIMQAAVKPTLSMLKGVMKGEAVPRVVQTLLDEGLNVTPHGLSTLQSLLGSTRAELRATLDAATAKGAPGINPFAVTRRLAEPAARAAQQVNARADVEAIGRVGNDFLEEQGGRLLPLAEANAVKQGTYQALGKKYGQLGSAEVEGQKALARGLKEEIEAQAPGVERINQRLGGLTEAEKAVGRRVALSANRDPVGFAWVAQNPSVFLAALFDRSPAVKSMIARGLYQSAGVAGHVAPQLIRAAVVALTTGASDASPVQE